MNVYRRGLREPHLDFVKDVVDAQGDAVFRSPDFAKLRLIIPIPKVVARNPRAAFDLSAWPMLQGRITDLCRSYHRKIEVEHTVFPEETQDSDEPQALWVVVIIPIPVALFRDVDYDIGTDVFQQAEEAAAVDLRHFQSRYAMGTT